MGTAPSWHCLQRAANFTYIGTKDREDSDRLWRQRHLPGTQPLGDAKAATAQSGRECFWELVDFNGGTSDDYEVVNLSARSQVLTAPNFTPEWRSANTRVATEISAVAPHTPAAPQHAQI